MRSVCCGSCGRHVQSQFLLSLMHMGGQNYMSHTSVSHSTQLVVLCRYTHPFATALDRLPSLYPGWMLDSSSPRPPSSMDTCPFVFVDSKASLAEMAEELSTVREFAVDLEHSDRCMLTAVSSLASAASGYWHLYLHCTHVIII